MRKLVGQVGVSIIRDSLTTATTPTPPLAPTTTTTNSLDDASLSSSSSSCSYCSAAVTTQRPLANTTNQQQPVTRPVDFIDSKCYTLNSRTSRTRLVPNTKANNMNTNSNLAHESSAPSKFELIKSYNNSAGGSYPTGYNTITNPSRYGMSTTTSSTTTPTSSSSILLMIQPNSTSTSQQPRRLSDMHPNGSSTAASSAVATCGSSVLTRKSLSSMNTNNNNVANSAAMGTNPTTPTTNMICAKYFEKTKFNVIGEQETLV